MRWKRKCYIIFPRKVVEEITWPEGWGHQCAGNLSDMLLDVLKVKTGIGSEWKMILSESHRWSVIKDHNVSNTELEDYLKADCSLLSFRSEKLKDRAMTWLRKNGAKSELQVVTEYRDVIIQQAYYKNNNKFNPVTVSRNQGN